jgi:FkbM family methyltransferase
MTESITIRGQKINYCNQPVLFRTAALDKWEPETFDALIRFVMPGKVFIDCGAWVGIFSIYAAKMGAKVFAIEPDSFAFPELLGNIDVNENSQNVVCARLALSDKRGQAFLNSMTGTFGNSESSLVDRGQIGGRQQVETDTLGGFVDRTKILPENICLIKIDVEAGEILLLQGAEDFLITHKPNIVIAFHPGWILNFTEDINKVIKIIFPIYDVQSCATKKIYNQEEFVAALKTTYDHTFILTDKK